MHYAPLIRSATTKQHLHISQYPAVVLTDIESGDKTKYLYILIVSDADTHEPCLFVSSEVNRLAKQFGGGSHFLGIFDDQGRSNCGASDDWADVDKFVAAATEIARQRLARA